MQFLNLPLRQLNPRTKGLTYLIDSGYPLAFYRDVIKSYGSFIDGIKFGWGTAYITKDINEKILLAKEIELSTFVGGTFFEKAFIQNKLDDFLTFISDLGCSCIEVSNGTINMSNREKANIISELSKDFQIISEVGYKDISRSEMMHPAQWIEYIQEDLQAGAVKVITEARETGSSGVCRSNGELRYGLIEEILQSGIDVNDLIFEAPNKKLQTYFIEHIGPNVNLANIPFMDALSLETLRLGLRADTLFIEERQ